MKLYKDWFDFTYSRPTQTLTSKILRHVTHTITMWWEWELELLKKTIVWKLFIYDHITIFIIYIDITAQLDITLATNTLDNILNKTVISITVWLDNGHHFIYIHFGQHSGKHLVFEGVTKSNWSSTAVGEACVVRISRRHVQCN